MVGCSRNPGVLLLVVLPLLVRAAEGQDVFNGLPPQATAAPAPAPERTAGPASFLHRMMGHDDGQVVEIVSMEQLAELIDRIDKSLYRRGKVVVKGPDVWGQNRLTQHRAEYEDQMKGQLDKFEIILSSYQRRADLAALTSATSVGASIQPQVTRSRNVTTTTNVTPPPVPSATGLVGSSGLVANANSLLGTQTGLLMPSNLTALALANKGAVPGIGLEPTVALDERSRFLNHIQQLRRINIGDDRSDLPGYGLYLVRMPVSVLPGSQSDRGKGAVVTVEAKHELTPDLLANTFRNVVILDTAYQLLDVVTRGQYLPISDDETTDCENKLCNPATTPATPGGGTGNQPRAAGTKPPNNGPMPTIRGASPVGPETAGSRAGVQGSAPSSEVVAIYGEHNLRKLVCSVKQDQEAWYRHDPSIVSWLLGELSAAHLYMREQARDPASPLHHLFQPDVFENIGSLALARDYPSLAVHRENWMKAVNTARNEQRVRPIDILAYALMVQSVFVDRQLKFDMHVMAERKGCACGDPYLLTFHALWPELAAQQAFATYVACKWPIHVFSLDPVFDQQNQLDLFSERTELQLALAAALSTGQANFQQATTYARRLEKDLAAVALNRTAVGFGAGETTFGWRFYPRIQTPPTESNPRRFGNILFNNGPGPDYELKNRQIEPGMRECYALVVTPNFSPMIRMTTVTNWFELKTHHPSEQELEVTDMLRLSRKLQDARSAMQRVCDSGRYRPVELELLNDRLTQLEAMLPMQGHRVLLPFEADLTGSEIFNSTTSALGPRLLTWYGEPPAKGGSIFIMGTGFTVHEMKAIAGGVNVKDVDMISRNVIRIDIPDNARVNKTETVQGVDGKPFTRSLIDVHVATPNGVSNHLLVEVPTEECPKPPGGPAPVTTTVTTTETVDPATGKKTTSTEYKTIPPGIVLPPGTYLPMGGNLPAGTQVAPGAVNVHAHPPGFLPGTVPNTPYATPPRAAEDASGSPIRSVPGMDNDVPPAPAPAPAPIPIPAPAEVPPSPAPEVPALPDTPPKSAPTPRGDRGQAGAPDLVPVASAPDLAVARVGMTDATGANPGWWKSRSSAKPRAVEAPPAAPASAPRPGRLRSIFARPPADARPARP